MKPPTRLRIQLFLQERGHLISESTFHRIRNDLQGGLGIEFQYQRERGYSIKAESAEELDRFLRLASIAQKGEQVKKALLHQKELFDYVLFEDSGVVKGIENLNPLIGAVLSRQKVTLNYKKFGAQKGREFSNVEPHFLKEFQGRWYVLVYVPDETPEVRTFAIDERIRSVQVEPEFFNRREEMAFGRIKEVVGLNYSESESHFGIKKAIDVLFEVNQAQQYYLEGLPIHQSQQFIKEIDGHRSLYKITVLPNYELAQAFLRLGPEVKVLEPKPFVAYLKKTIKSMSERYN